VIKPGAVGRLNNHEPWPYLGNLPERLPTHMNNRMDAVLAHLRMPLA
jgi:hypothetical protein